MKLIPWRLELLLIRGKSRVGMSLKGKTLFITGGSRGIGKAIALRAAKDGANVVIAAKTTEENPRVNHKLLFFIYSFLCSYLELFFQQQKKSSWQEAKL